MIVQVENPVLEVHDLTVTYDRRPVLWDIDFSLPAGKLVGIVGPNGSGKTTLVKSIMGLLPIGSGYVKIFGKELDDVRSRVSYMPQRESIDWDFPANVMDVVLMGRYGKLGLFKRPGKKDKAIAWNSLEKVGMKDFATRQISQLSGGQQQRVFMARAIAQDADLYLMDEPFAGVDAATESAIFEVLQEMRSAGKTLIIIHHDLHSANKFFDWIILLNTRLIASGEIDNVFTPELLETAYGSKLSVLSRVGQEMQKQEFPMREKPEKP